jgi:uridine kinase
MVIDSPMRRAVLERVATAITGALASDRVTLIAIDGVDGAGKSTFADELKPHLEESGRQVIRASVDSFHRPRAERYARGRNSAEGFYRDSYDYEALKKALLDPLRHGRGFRRALFDVEADQLAVSDAERSAPGSILVFDGIFLQRAELRGYWDLSIYLDVPWEKNHHLAGHPEWNLKRYSEGQRIYIRECDPRAAANIVIDNTNLTEPSILSQRASG